MESINRIFTLTKRNIKEIIRDPLSLVFMLALPLFMEILFYFLFHELTAQFEMKYLAPGIVVFSQSFLALFTGILIATDRNTSFLTRLYVSKAKSYEFILSYALSVMPIVLVQSILFFIIGGIIDPTIFCIGMVWAILISLVTSLLFIALGILFGSLCNEKSIGGVTSIVIVGQSVLSGMWFPTEGLSGGMVTLMKVFPFKNATDVVNNVLNGAGSVLNDVIMPLLIVLGYTIISFVAAILTFKHKMKDK